MFTLENMENGLEFMIMEDGTAIVSGYDGESREITIPSVFHGHAVTSIGIEAFKGCCVLTSITIPGSVTWIGRSAFEGCSGLTGIVLPKHVTEIENGAFKGCSGLIGLVLPGSVTEIGEEAFRNCSRLTDIMIPDSVTWIGARAFCGCAGLKSVVIPGSLIRIGSEVCPDEYDSWAGKTIINSIPIFSECGSLTGIQVSENNPEYTTYEGCLFNKDLSFMIRCPEGKTGIFVIPHSVTEISSGAFCKCSELTGIVIPDSVTEIGYETFKDCTGLTGIVIPDSITEIGDDAFKGCTGLTNIVIPVSVAEIGDDAFKDCGKSLTAVVSPGSYAEEYCIDHGIRIGKIRN